MNIPDDRLEGPTIKYFTQNVHKPRPYRLSWRRDVDKSEYTIETKVIKPIGRVVGLYRKYIDM